MEIESMDRPTPGPEPVVKQTFFYWWSWEALSRSIVEFTSCMMFHFIGSVCPTPQANGIALIVLVYYAAKVSGAHLNPAVSLTFCLLGHTDPFEMVLYWISQLAGCIVGALWIAALVPGATLVHGPRGAGFPGDGCFAPEPALSRAQTFGWEALGTFCFIVPVFSVVWYTQHKKGYGNAGPLIVGLSLMASALACGPYTGAALNPARALGSLVVFGCPYRWVFTDYVLAELVGATATIFAIAPWYGISSQAWYRIPDVLISATNKTLRPLELQTIPDKEPVVATLPPAMTRVRGVTAPQQRRTVTVKTLPDQPTDVDMVQVTVEP